MGAYLDEIKCPICGKNFIIPPENIYKFTVNGKLQHYCSYTCYRKVQKERESGKIYKQKAKYGGRE